MGLLPALLSPRERPSAGIVWSWSSCGPAASRPPPQPPASPSQHPEHDRACSKCWTKVHVEEPCLGEALLQELQGGSDAGGISEEVAELVGADAGCRLDEAPSSSNRRGALPWGSTATAQKKLVGASAGAAELEYEFSGERERLGWHRVGSTLLEGRVPPTPWRDSEGAAERRRLKRELRAAGVSATDARAILRRAGVDAKPPREAKSIGSGSGGGGSVMASPRRTEAPAATAGRGAGGAGGGAQAHTNASSPRLSLGGGFRARAPPVAVRGTDAASLGRFIGSGVGRVRDALGQQRAAAAFEWTTFMEAAQRSDAPPASPNAKRRNLRVRLAQPYAY
jgi:hypothetical protein